MSTQTVLSEYVADVFVCFEQNAKTKIAHNSPQSNWIIELDLMENDREMMIKN